MGSHREGGQGKHQRATGGFVPRVLPKKLKSTGMGARLPGRRTLEVSVLSRPWLWEELGNTLQGRRGEERGKMGSGRAVPKRHEQWDN